MKCREGCAACCIYLSISSPIPGMPNGKPAGVRCIHLSEDLKCNIFTSPDRPKVCAGFIPEKLFCGESAQEAYKILAGLENINVADNIKRSSKL
ncbi:MAG: YkgJ family cysteine cluster protein [Bacteroidales bacterium]|nr:YkgJ family cysteine cluster protein [Bacteroidales bacterium]